MPLESGKLTLVLTKANIYCNAKRSHDTTNAYETDVLLKQLKQNQKHERQKSIIGITKKNIYTHTHTHTHM